jgi:magnesium transporter
MVFAVLKTGRHVDHLPELHWTDDYPIVMTVILVVCLVRYRTFRRNHWL